MNIFSENEAKWALANEQLGLKPDEICPGLTVDQHAESLAMFEMHNTPGNNRAWALSIPVLASVHKKRIMSEPLEDEIESLG